MSEIKTITSRTNETVKLVADLHSSKGREEQKRFIAEGARTCQTLVENGMELVQMYATQEEFATVKEFTKNYFITIVDDHVMQKMSGAKSPSGILGVFKIPSQPSFSNIDSGLVLAQVADPGNVGSLIRTCAALKIKSVIAVDSTDIWSPKVVQASAGTLAQVQIYTPSWPVLLKWKKDFKLCALVVKGGKAPSEFDFNKTLLVVGNEANGIPKDWLRDMDSYLTLPMPGNTESLNAAVAGSIALYLAFAKQ
ncbi:MAG: RNA methyltransferase [Candidatus Babeliales bacterium]